MTEKEILQQRLIDVTNGLIAALERKHPYTKGHSDRVSMYAVALGKHLSDPMSDEDLTYLRIAASCHDIGKLSVEESTLDNPSRLLSTDQVVEIEDHPYHAVRILLKCHVPIPRVIINGIYGHHERWDGNHDGDLTGYPMGIGGNEISLFARIIAIADTFDAMTTKRSYQASHSESEACEMLRAQAGRKLDPDLVEIFLTKALPKCHT